MKKNINSFIQRLSLILYPLTGLYFWFSRWVTDCAFIAKSYPKLGRPPFLSYPFLFILFFSLILKKAWRISFSNYAIKQFSKLTPLHYSPKGRGYFSLRNLSDDEKRKQYTSLPSRLSYFVKHNTKLITYTDGDTFLDAGCGMGQTIRFLSSEFSNSKIFGFDINDDALSIITTSETNTNLVVENGSILDENYISSISDSSFDHVILSHVMGFICDGDTKKTILKRQAVVDNLIRISKKSFLIVDHLSLDEDITIQIEQKNRCLVHDKITRYFDKHLSNGELYILPSPETTGFYYAKR